MLRLWPPKTGKFQQPQNQNADSRPSGRALVRLVLGSLAGTLAARIDDAPLFLWRPHAEL
jgi:hypothetical protein